MQHLSADLETALTFVIERIGEEAERSGAPLDDEELGFLSHLPTQPTNPTITAFNTAYEELWPTPVLRDFRFERLCNLAREAHSHDLRTRPDGAREWEFAAAVLQLRRHPMSWLLKWAHIRTVKRASRWDRLLLVATAAFVVVLFLLGAFAVSALTDGQRDIWKWTLWVVGGCIYGVLITLLYFAVQRLEARQQEQHIEKYRCNPPVRGSAFIRR
jgi:hypothetical protein